MTQDLVSTLLLNSCAQSKLISPPQRRVYLLMRQLPPGVLGFVFSLSYSHTTGEKR